MATIYMKCTNDKYELPVAVADSPKELAQLLHIKRNLVNSAISHKHKTFVKVEVDDEES